MDSKAIKKNKLFALFWGIDVLILTAAVFLPTNSVEVDPLTKAVDLIVQQESAALEKVSPEEVETAEPPRTETLATPAPAKRSVPARPQPAPTPIAQQPAPAQKQLPPKIQKDEAEPEPLLASEAAEDPQDPKGVAPQTVLEAAVAATDEPSPPEATAPPTRDAGELRAAPTSENKKPNYPEEDRKAHREGVVSIRFFVTPQGQVDQAGLVNNTGSAAMGESALGTLLTYRFDTNQSGWWEREFKFSMNGESEQ